METLVEVTRGGLVESTHVGTVVVVDAEGKRVAVAGDPGQATFLRSSAKPLQALSLLEPGGAARFGLTGEEIALVCASHSGEPFHAECAARILARGGFDESALQCGAHDPYDDASTARLRAAGTGPGQLHNNCSGKHGGMLLACRLRGWDPASYRAPAHPLQLEILARIERWLSVPRDRIGIGVDGCSAPTFHVPIEGMARAYARLLEDAPEAWPLSDAERAARNLATATMRRWPEFVGGTTSVTTALMRLFGGRLLAKEGAEAFYSMGVVAGESARVRAVLGLPDGPPRALGIALKVFDGGRRGREIVILEVLAQLGLLPDELPPLLARHRRPPVRNVRGEVVGEMRPAFRLQPVR